MLRSALLSTRAASKASGLRGNLLRPACVLLTSLRHSSFVHAARDSVTPPAHRRLPAPSATGTVFASSAAGEPYGSMSCTEVHGLVSSGAYQYVDVRTPEEFAAGHPEGSANVPVMLKSASDAMEPNQDFLAQFQKSYPEKGAQLCVGCASGKRSLTAALMLAQAGYSAIVNVEGGFQAWSREGLPVSK